MLDNHQQIEVDNNAAEEKALENMTQEELIALVKKLQEKRVKYGLVWEDHEEDVVKLCKDNLPVLQEVAERFVEGAIKTKTALENEQLDTFATTEEENLPTENINHILIEGDNYHALSVLNYTHKGKIDVIYIDPPYNTENEGFIYNDKLVDKNDTFRHSKWLSFIHKRLDLARHLLNENAVFVVSIDDNEVAQLKILLNSFFAENVKIIAVKMSEASGLKMGATKKIGNIPKYKEYLIFSRLGGLKNLYFEPIKKSNWDDEYNLFLKNFEEEDKNKLDVFLGIENKDEDLLGKVDKEILSKIEIVTVNSVLAEQGLRNKKDILDWKYRNSWRICRTAASSSVKNIADIKRKYCDQLIFSIVSKRDNILYLVKGDYDILSSSPRIQLIFAVDNLTSHPGDFWQDIKTTGLEAEGGVVFKNGKKPLELIKRIVKSHNNPNAIVLDFFAGSGTTAHAVMQLNAEDGGNRQCILVTNNENNICEEVTFERCKRVIEGYTNLKGEKVQGLAGNNLRYFKTDFVPYTLNSDQIKFDITRKCAEMLCLKENVFDKVSETQSYKIFKSGNKYVAMYFELYSADLQQLRDVMNDIEGEKVLYFFNLDREPNMSEFSDWKNIRKEPIPQKILELYKSLFRKI